MTKTGRAGKAEQILRPVLTALEAQPTRSYPHIVPVMIGLSESMIAQKRLVEAARVASEAYDKAVHNLGDQNPLTKNVANILAKIHEKKVIQIKLKNFNNAKD